MAYLDWLENQGAVALGRGTIGEPVALRAYLRIAADHGLLLGTLARSMTAAGRWFDAPPWRFSVHGDLAAGHMTALVEFRNGRTALLATEAVRQDMPDVVLLFFGNRGTMRFDDSPRAAEPGEGPPDLIRLIEGALRSAETVEVPDGR